MEESPHKCPTCGRSFNQRSNLKTHLLTHTDLKPYKCSTCNAVFRRNCDLRRHMLTHSIGGHLPSDKTDDKEVTPTLPKGNAPGPKVSSNDLFENQNKVHDSVDEEDDLEEEDDEEEIDPGRPDDAYAFYKNSNAIHEDPCDEQDDDEDLENEEEYRFSDKHCFKSNDRFPINEEKYQNKFQHLEDANNEPIFHSSPVRGNTNLEPLVDYEKLHQPATSSSFDLTKKSLDDSYRGNNSLHKHSSSDSLSMNPNAHSNCQPPYRLPSQNFNDNEESMQEVVLCDMSVDGYSNSTSVIQYSGENQCLLNGVNNDHVSLRNQGSLSDIKPQTFNSAHSSCLFTGKLLNEPVSDCSSNPLSRFTKISGLVVPLSEQSPVTSIYTSTPHASPLSPYCSSQQETGPPLSNSSTQLVSESSSLMKLCVSSPASSYAASYSQHFRSPSQQSDLKRGIDQVLCDNGRSLQSIYPVSVLQPHLSAKQHHMTSTSLQGYSKSCVAASACMSNNDILDLTSGQVSKSEFATTSRLEEQKIISSSIGQSFDKDSSTSNISSINQNIEFHQFAQQQHHTQHQLMHVDSDDSYQNKYLQPVPQLPKQNGTDKPKKKGFMIEDIMSR